MMVRVLGVEIERDNLFVSMRICERVRRARERLKDRERERDRTGSNVLVRWCEY